LDKKSNSVIGVLDFKDAIIGDPAIDLATQLHLGKNFARLVLKAYQDQKGVVDEWLWYRMKKYFVLRELRWFYFALKVENLVEFEESIRKIRRSLNFTQLKSV